MLLIELAGEVALLVLIPLVIVILFYLAKIVALSVKEKTSSFVSLNRTGLQEKYRVELMKIREQSENEEIRILVDAILNLFPANYRITAEPGTLKVQEKRGEVKVSRKEDTKERLSFRKWLPNTSIQNGLTEHWRK